MKEDRRQAAYRVRVEAAELAKQRTPVVHRANGDEARYASVNYAMSFSKGLQHDPTTGLVKNAADFESFRSAIDNAAIDAFTLNVPASARKGRQWEAPTAGVVYDLQGPDCQAVTMPPAPALGTMELAYEMAEVYELALLRDEPLNDLADGANNPRITASINRLNGISYPVDGSAGRSRLTEPHKSGVSEQTVFRGSSPGVEAGPYVSQFLWIGSPHVCTPGIGHGYIHYGPLQINQRVPVARKKDYLTTWTQWLGAQDGVHLRVDEAELFDCSADRRFICTGRDLATYVHDDALYEAYLNACLILLGMKAPFDPGFASLAGQGDLFLNSLDFSGSDNGVRALETHPRQAGGFALWGGPHILTLVTEVATRALKAVRYQKFNNHLRLRPEALAGRIECEAAIRHEFPTIGKAFEALGDSIKDTVTEVKNANGTALLPMAFQEGSPMHPSYGAGHATVAGACVTILKAYFDTSAVLSRRNQEDAFRRYKKCDKAVHYKPSATGAALHDNVGGEFLTLEGELNKLAANISIGRNMAGVHYFSDYYDSLRMGEEIAIGILEEQALCYPVDSFVLTVPTFDGGERRIGRQ